MTVTVKVAELSVYNLKSLGSGHYLCDPGGGGIKGGQRFECKHFKGGGQNFSASNLGGAEFQRKLLGKDLINA